MTIRDIRSIVCDIPGCHEHEPMEHDDFFRGEKTPAGWLSIAAGDPAATTMDICPRHMARILETISAGTGAGSVEAEATP
jgi:hypothetical protein